MKQDIENIIKKNLPEKKDVSEWKDGNLVQFESYSCYINEGSSEEFSEEPDNFSMGVILGNKVFGDGMASDYELTKEDFKQGVWITGVDENGGHDAWEYCKATIIPNQALSQIDTSLIADEVLKVVVENYKKAINNFGEQNQITQAILSSMEYRGFYDCGKYLDKDIWDKIKPIILQLLSNLSPNKKNENNTKESGIVDLETMQESDFCAYEVESKDDLCGKPQYKGGFCKRHYRKVYGDF